jgi:hypothetical protein
VSHGAGSEAAGGVMKLYKNRVLSPGMVRCPKCGTQFDPRMQSAACHKSVRHYPIARVSEWKPPAQPSPGKPRRRADFQSDFMLLWDETQPYAAPR